MSSYAPVAKRALFAQKPDFFARRTHFVEHLAPIWNLLPENERGIFYVPDYLVDHAKRLGIKATGLRSWSNRSEIKVIPPGRTPLVTCAYGDMEQGYRSYTLRPFVLMEHGVGLSFNHPGYGGGVGLRKRVNLFLAPNQNIYNKTKATFPEAPQVIIGTPKMDSIVCEVPVRKEKPVIAIAFHWDGSAVCPEAGNALKHYKDILPELAKHFQIIGHGHPKIINKIKGLYEDAGITIEKDFPTIMRKADIYINDASSTMFEFACTGKPVVILNAPWFRRDVHHGIRFWLYTDIGVNVDDPCDLIPAINRTIDQPAEFYEERKKMIAEIYPYVGCSAERAARAITEFLRSKYDGTAFDFE